MNTLTRLFWVGLIFGMVIDAHVALAQPVLVGHTDRPLRYRPEGTDFLIENGPELFNRPLYIRNTAMRVDAGDQPEFSLYLPGRGGNLRLGVRVGAKAIWANQAKGRVARYRPAEMVYDIQDPLVGSLTIHLLTLAGADGYIVRVDAKEVVENAELIFAFGGSNGDRGRRNGDIGCEPQPVSQLFALKPAYCRDNAFALDGNRFELKSKPGTLIGQGPAGSKLQLADSAKWESPSELFASASQSPAGEQPSQPVVIGSAKLSASQPLYIVVQKQDAPIDPAAAYEQAAARAKSLREKVVVDTPDPFINAAVAALNVAADSVWDEKQGAVMHGGVAWRVKLLGWRGPYANDALGWHDRADRHFTYWASQQNTSEIPATQPGADQTANLSRSEAALHSNGDMSKSHYDMNLVNIDALFRHLMWTGDMKMAKAVWPVIQRHLAWEQRLFRRPFGPEKLPLYEAYCCIWASDDVWYSGGGATHSTAYNYLHNRLAAKLAKAIGEDPAPYNREAELIAKAMQQQLWLSGQGWFAESKDLLGLQLVHPNPATWTMYHTIDSAFGTEACSAMQAWQMTRYVDTQIAHIPIHGPGVPKEDLFTVPTTNWMPYAWSTNNVVMAEAGHTALAFWQANRPETAYKLFKGLVLDSMYLGLCPGNAGMSTTFDVARGESQRDFADASGVCSRAVVEGLFGVKPDAIAGEIVVRPGFPAKWERASIKHTDFSFAFAREALRETYTITPTFAVPMKLRLQLAAMRDQIQSVTVNEQQASWKVLDDSVDEPRIEIQAPASARCVVTINWKGDAPAPATAAEKVAFGADFKATFGAAKVLEIQDPQNAITKAASEDHLVHGSAAGAPGHHTIFVKLQQSALTWWSPVAFEITASDAAPAGETVALKTESTQFDSIDLSTIFNDRVTQIFKNQYLSPRSPFCSLSLPTQGFGSWCHPESTFDVDDTGLRRSADQNGGSIPIAAGLSFKTPGAGDAKNIAFVSQWDNYPKQLELPLDGKATHAHLLMAGSTNSMQSQFDNGEVIVTYADGSTGRLALRNPTTWWPIDQDYLIDDFAFRRPEPLPIRVDLKTGKVRVLEMQQFKGRGRNVNGGAATVLNMPLDPNKPLKSITVRALANDVVIGLMGVTLSRN